MVDLDGGGEGGSQCWTVRPKWGKSPQNGKIYDGIFSRTGVTRPRTPDPGFLWGRGRGRPLIYRFRKRFRYDVYTSIGCITAYVVNYDEIWRFIPESRYDQMAKNYRAFSSISLPPVFPGSFFFQVSFFVLSSMKMRNSFFRSLPARGQRGKIATTETVVPRPGARGGPEVQRVRTKRNNFEGERRLKDWEFVKKFPRGQQCRKGGGGLECCGSNQLNTADPRN